MNKEELKGKQASLEYKLGGLRNPGIRGFHCKKCNASPGEACKDGLIFKKELWSSHQSRTDALNKWFEENNDSIKEYNKELKSVQEELYKLYDIECEEKKLAKIRELEQLVESELTFETAKQREIHINIRGDIFIIAQTKNTKSLHPKLKLPIKFLDRLSESSVDIIALDTDYYDYR